jgi:hypothetical protein
MMFDYPSYLPLVDPERAIIKVADFFGRDRERHFLDATPL